MNLPEFSVRRPVTTLMVFFAALVVGGMCLWLLPIDLMPEIEIPAITVITMYEGAAPEDVEAKVTEPLEGFLTTVPELKHITSKSKEGISIITLSFEWGSNMDSRANEVRDSVGMAGMVLPDETDEPLVLKFDIARFPIIIYGVMAQESYPQLQDILEDQVANPLKRLAGVGSAAVRLPLIRQINVQLDRGRLAAYSLTPQDVVRAIRTENKDTPAGNIKMGLTDYLVRVPGEFDSVTPLRQIVVAARNGSIVRLSDLGTVEDGFKEFTRYITINGSRGGVLMVQKESGANTVEVARKVRKRMDELKKRLPPDVQIINIMDSSEDVERSIRDLSRTLIMGAIFAMLVVFFFLRRWRAALIIGLTIPFSLIIAIILIYFLDYTINMITLFGLIIAVGMVVDNAIVILENVTRHREAGERPKEGAMYGAREVTMAITASTFTTVCIFFPVLYVKGIIEIIFSEFAVVVAVAIMGSLFSAITLTPMLSATLMKKEKFGKGNRGKLFNLSESAFTAIEEIYAQLLKWALGHRKTVVMGSLLIFGGTLFLTPMLGTEFFPEEDRALLRGTLYLPVGTRVEETARVMAELDRLISEEVAAEERVAIYTSCGSSAEGIGSAFGEEGSHIITFGIKLVPRVKRSRNTKQITAALRRGIEDVRGLLRIEKYRFEGGDPMEGMLMGGERALTVNIIGNDLDVTDRIAEKIKQIASNIPGAVDISLSRVKGKPELWVDVEREKASALGLNLSDIGDTVRASFYGRTASKFRVQGDEYDIFVQLRMPDRSDIKNVLATRVRLPGGGMARVDNFASLSMKRGPLEIERKDQGRIVNVTGSVEGRSLGEVANDIEAEIKKLDIPEGVEVIMAGQSEQQRESFFWLTVALCVGLVLIYMVMASQFESLVDPFVIMFSVPFALTGAIWAIFLGGHHISIVVFIGLLMLIGIVVNNAIVLVDYINILRARGKELSQAVQEGGKTRLRPVLMTALTTIVALLPMAFGRGQGAEIWNPLGLTVLGGLLVSTFVTLILVPTMYSIFGGRLKLKRDR